MAALLIRRRRPIGEPAAIAPTSNAPTLDGTRGAGRIVQAVTELGVDLGSVLQVVVEPEASAAQIDGLELGRVFDVVVLGSHLVNRPEEAVRQALLALARRHLAPDLAPAGRLLIEHHPIDWAETAADVRPTPGGPLGMLEVRREPPFVSAVSVYDVGGRVVRQPFTARVLSEQELSAACSAAGLAVRRRLGPTWLEASMAASPGA
jgi:hypothetical protein